MKRNRFRNRVPLRGDAAGVVSQAGIELLYRAARAGGLDLDRNWPWTPAILAAGHRLDALTA